MITAEHARGMISGPGGLRDLAVEVFAELSDRSPVLVTVHGSHLYGTAHSGSDVDVYAVVGRGRNRSRVVDGMDVAVVGLDTFLEQVAAATHQAVEALFSPVAEISPEYAGLLSALRPSPYEFEIRARGALKGLDSDSRMSDDKRTRHRRRLEWEIGQMLAAGWFDPTAGPDSAHR